MESQSVYEPIKRSKGASSDLAPLTRLPYNARLKKASRSVEADVSYFCSAFLADRGCFSSEKPQKQNAA
jgi:hypothetical protein